MRFHQKMTFLLLKKKKKENSDGLATLGTPDRNWTTAASPDGAAGATSPQPPALARTSPIYLPGPTLVDL